MKALLLSAAAALMFLNAPATASVIVLGSSAAESCYRSAESRDTSPKARIACDRALELDALSARDTFATHVNRGILWMIAGDLGRADLDFDQAIDLYPRMPQPWLNKAIMQLNAGNSAAALKLAQRSIELRTDKPALAYYVRGVAHEDTGNIAAAYSDLKTAASLAPNWNPPAVELARYQFRRR